MFSDIHDEVVRDALTGKEGVPFYTPEGKLAVVIPGPSYKAPPGHTMDFNGVTLTVRHTWGLGSSDVVPTMWGVRADQGGK